MLPSCFRPTGQTYERLRLVADGHHVVNEPWLPLLVEVGFVARLSDLRPNDDTIATDEYGLTPEGVKAMKRAGER
jgi:hypothetical protein